MSIKSGYFKKHLRVDLTEDRMDRLDLPDEFLEKYIGGRGFGAKLVWDNLLANDFKIDPLGPENLLVIAPVVGKELLRCHLPGHGHLRRFFHGRAVRSRDEANGP